MANRHGLYSPVSGTVAPKRFFVEQIEPIEKAPVILHKKRPLNLCTLPSCTGSKIWYNIDRKVSGGIRPWKTRNFCPANSKFNTWKVTQQWKRNYCVYNPYGTLVVSSYCTDSAVELIRYTPEVSGNHRIVVKQIGSRVCVSSITLSYFYFRYYW